MIVEPEGKMKNLQNLFVDSKNRKTHVLVSTS